MKKATKTLLLMLCAVVLVVSSILGTVAYLTSDAKIENTFSVGNVDITMKETKVDKYGVVLAGADAGTTEAGQEYKLLPGREYTKDPKITVTAGSEPCWLFVKVENGIAAYETGSIATQLAANGWTLVDDETNVYWHAVVDAREGAKEIKVFDTFTVADEADAVPGWADIKPADTKITVTAYAVQQNGFESGAKAAWDATFGN